ncbi:N-acetyl-gamma-glutamyl-phosphate reductase [Lachnoclostridium sp. Marseille-P6806]|uniref:N-acetyl-gamma-glutamyl-phosphate reductase n=1 Tax=Lachnoclostridium sp. Marseille-P6806 TaxID=2364793 RepID=UPI001030514A|nr:N-acetyl-gamma-glutamyl-phosphate reductase [Lachnoclostridium sp. Marseille-P6806]
MIRAGVVGATGYAGAEIAALLMGHPQAELVWAGSRSFAGHPLSEVYGNLRGISGLVCIDDDTETLRRDILRLAEDVDVIFTATPQGASSSLVTEELLEKVKVIDLSADFRFADTGVYEQWYGIRHGAPTLVKQAVYGLSELMREEIRHTRLLANPGCFTTCAILTVYPLIKEGLVDPNTLIIDALSGVSGAGRGAKIASLFCEVNENVKAYGVTSHRHTPEIEEQLGKAAGRALTLQFTPHLVPMNRGILVTGYAELAAADGSGLCGAAAARAGVLPQEETLRAVYEKYYGGEHFIRLLPGDDLPETRFVEGSNDVDINFRIDSRTGRVVMLGALDNLVKGAAGQAVQNMNIMFGLPESSGLELVPRFP